MSIALIVLAAGKGTRMKSDHPKVLHRIAGAPMLHHALRAGGALSPDRTVVVAGHGSEAVADATKDFDTHADIVLQTEQLGTAHAVAQAGNALKDHAGDAVVLYGDTPFISPETLTRMAKARDGHDVVILGFEAADPGRYGRLVMQGDTLEKIVEFKDAGVRERAITFCNSGVVMARTETLFSLVDAVDNENASGEYYLTDIVEVARARGLSATAIACDEAETLGVNSRSDLAVAEEVFQSAKRRALMDKGVTLTAPDTVFFAYDTEIESDTVVEPHVVFGPGVKIDANVQVRAFSHLEGCRVAAGAVVGPYARLRPGTDLAAGTRIGNFVEIKNATLAQGAKVNHLSYIGDASVGTDSNIGAGTVTCNYDGVMKHRTVIGDRVFIGSDTMLVAPVTIGDEAMTGSGSVITRDVAEGALAIARPEQVEKPGMARKLFEILKLKKQKRLSGES
ncbi:bifunctional UDP-N-acetylglucosamine diphosphorylase/glucosamine-1-phosphate N-acetyltransferase GlmU [Roseovarius sp. E0-M6]|uniref:bifunctional UDP-N-acetylglucosamine diphosphorylase/glucosamine-1-phosphate N-acetyltransferase GlmU n=1 Tax=Roseovarius sp. E0-M6 TaxID=3127118 RepID=UPI003010090F